MPFGCVGCVWVGLSLATPSRLMTCMASNVGILLDKIDEGVAAVRAHYEMDLHAKHVSDELLYAVRNVVQDCQSALDWTASDVKDKYGPSRGRSPYFPLVKDRNEIADKLDAQIKGLAAKAPDVAV